MTQDANPAVPQPDGTPDTEPAEDVSNDSLGTVDPADSTGLDSEEARKSRAPVTKSPE